MNINKTISAVKNYFLKNNKDKSIVDLIVFIKLKIYLIENIDFKKVNIGWNSTNPPIKSPNHSIVDDIGDIAKFISQIKKFKEGSLTNSSLNCGFLSSSSNQINITKYFIDKHNEFLNVEIYTKKFLTYVKELLDIYELEINNVKDNTKYKSMIINKVLTELKTTLESLSSMK